MFKQFVHVLHDVQYMFFIILTTLICVMKSTVILRYGMFVIYKKIFTFISRYLKKNITYPLLICPSLLNYLIYPNTGGRVHKV